MHLLHEEMNLIVPHHIYPSEVVPMPQLPDQRISGTAFFPGGLGLYLEDRRLDRVLFPFHGVMVLGHNFDCENNFKNSQRHGRERLTSGTWARLLRILRTAEVPLDRCFFTNAFVGLCRGNSNLDYKGRTDAWFRAACISFLQRQIRYQRPNMIITLGRYVPPLLAELSVTLNQWKRCEQKDPSVMLKEMDVNPIVREAIVDLGDGSQHTTTVVPLAHASLPNNRWRRPVGYANGENGEIQLVQAAWAVSQTQAEMKNCVHTAVL